MFALGLVSVQRLHPVREETIAVVRDFYGVIKVNRTGVGNALTTAHSLMHGRIQHGFQFAVDLLALDAFSGDAIPLPLHLLTKEAFAAYWDRPKPDGVLAVHISNHYLNLGPLVRGLAELSGREALRIENFKNTKNGSDASTWILVTNSRIFLDDPAVRSATVNWQTGEVPIVFTDAFSNLFELLR